MTKPQLLTVISGLVTLTIVLEMVVLQVWGVVAVAVFIAAMAPLMFLGACLMVGIQRKWFG